MESIDLIITLTGSSFSGMFLDSFIKIIQYLVEKNITFKYNRAQGSFIQHTRDQQFGLSNCIGEYSNVFGGNFDYKYILSIDSDNLVSGEQILKLMNHNKDIVGFSYLQPSGYLACCEKYDWEYFHSHKGHRMLTLQDLEDRKDILIPVEFLGFGCLLIKKGVFESIPIPHFASEIERNGNYIGICGEDVSFCKKAKDAGYQILLDPSEIISHEKLIRLTPKTIGYGVWK